MLNVMFVCSLSQCYMANPLSLLKPKHEIIGNNQTPCSKFTSLLKVLEISTQEGPSNIPFSYTEGAHGTDRVFNLSSSLTH